MSPARKSSRTRIGGWRPCLIATAAALAASLSEPALAFGPASNAVRAVVPWRCSSPCGHVGQSTTTTTTTTTSTEHATYLLQRRSLGPLRSSLMADIEAQAATAADTWSVEATPFMEPDLASQVEEKFQDRGDVVAFRVVGGRRLPAESSDDLSPGEGIRSRFVLMHPDLGLDVGTAESEYCTVIRVENVNVAASNTFPNALASIGVHLDNVGDIIVEDSSTVYLVVDPNVAKQCLRLLSKELVGAGITLSVCEENEFMPHGVVQEMKLSRILERQMERKKYEQGYVQFA